MISDIINFLNVPDGVRGLLFTAISGKAGNLIEIFLSNMDGKVPGSLAGPRSKVSNFSIEEITRRKVVTQPVDLPGPRQPVDQPLDPSVVRQPLERPIKKSIAKSIILGEGEFFGYPQPAKPFIDFGE